MKKYSIIIFSLLIIAIGGLTGCKSSKSTTDKTSEEVITTNKALTELAKSYSDWNTFSSSGKASIGGTYSFSTSMQIRMVKDKSVIISIRPVLGIEVAKVFIDNDSAVVINKLHKVYTSVDLKRFEHIMPMSIGTIQDIILSRVFSINDGTLSSGNASKFQIADNAAGNGYVVSPRKKFDSFAYQFALNENTQVESLDVFPAGSTKSYSVKYSDFASSAAGSGASNMQIDMQMSGKDLSLGMYINPSKTSWNSNVDDSPNISKSYKKVSVKEFLSILKSL